MPTSPTNRHMTSTISRTDVENDVEHVVAARVDHGEEVREHVTGAVRDERRSLIDAGSGTGTSGRQRPQYRNGRFNAYQVLSLVGIQREGT